LFDEGFILLLLELLFIGKLVAKPLDAPRNGALGGLNRPDGTAELFSKEFRF
jgi:hypothetical protein